MTRSKPKKTQSQLAFAAWLKAQRDQHGLTASEAAQRARVDPTTWRGYEAPGMVGHAPSLRIIRGIAAVFGVPVDEVAARAGVAVPTISGYVPTGSPSVPPETMMSVIEQLAEAHLMILELQAKLSDSTGGARPARKRRAPTRPQP